jgi:hypothetical protein
MARTSRPWNRISPAMMRQGSSSRRHGLARAGFTDDAQRLATGNRKAHPIDGAHDAFIGEKLRLEVAHLQHGRAAAGGRLGFGRSVVQL